MRSSILVVALLLAASCSGSEHRSGAAGSGGSAGASGGSSGTNLAGEAGQAGDAGATNDAGSAGTASEGGAAGTQNDSGGQGGEGGAAPSALDAILAALIADRDAALLAYSKSSGWPIAIDGEFLFVSADTAFATLVIDGGSGLGMQVLDDFAWVLAPASAGNSYAFSDGATTAADPWSRSYDFDQTGLVSLLAPTDAHLDRHFDVSDGALQPRIVRVWVPQAPATHVLYAQDGQNLFDPDAPLGGWNLQEAAPAAMMVVGIDNTPDRLDEYTHVQDSPSGVPVGGNADAYIDFLENAVRPLIGTEYGEAPARGLLGSSIGGLFGFYAAHELPASYDFAASLSGTMGWGSIGVDVHNTTLLELYAAAQRAGVVLYLDSGGSDTPACNDADADGVDDDGGNGDNYCENAQLYSILKAAGYVDGVDVHYHFEPGATHDEAAWGARVSLPLSLFAAL